MFCKNISIYLFKGCRFLPVIVAGLLCIFAGKASAQTNELLQNFLKPSTAAKPSAWWFWGESITTENGITKDLEAMKRVGFGGVVLYEQVFIDAPDALKSLSPEWMAKVRFAAAECARLGMRLEVNTSNGYVAGGPWITPDLGMQRLVSSETNVAGGKKLSIKLEQPPTKLNYYKDVAVMAFPTPANHILPAPKFSSVPQVADLEKMFEYGTSTKVRVKPSPLHVMVLLDYGQPVTARSITYALRAGSKALIIATQVQGNWSSNFYGENMTAIPNIGELEASTDNVHWKTLRQLPGRGYQFEGWDKQTLSFPATTARYFRLNLHDWGRNERAKDDDILIGSIKIHGSARTDQWEKKSGNTVDFSAEDQTPAYQPTEVVQQTALIDLTKLTDAEGNLNWDAPKGNWTILRFGHTPTGIKTKHGRPETTGLECDKLSADAVRVQFDNYVGRILKEIRTVPGAKLNGVNMDSAEHGTQNWTAKFAAEFFKRRGYKIEPYLPAMAGYVVNSKQQTDRFLYDVRLTIADMMSDNYYGAFKKLCNNEGLTFMAQAPGIATCLPSDNIQAKGRTDIPMAEFWMSQENGTIDCKEASSAAHVYGKNIVAAESFTGSMPDLTPAKMKPLADAALAQGINRFVMLAYMHQPYDDRKPGVTEDRFYLPNQRHNTWWEQGAGFWNTLARSSAMLQSGKPVVDLLYHLGSDAPVKIATWRMRPVPPVGYDYDVCSDEILLSAYVKNGRICLPSGMSYKLLVLAAGKNISLAAAKHIQKLVKDGAMVLGDEKPLASPSLSDGKNASQQVLAIGQQLWNAPGKVKSFGKGKLIVGFSPAKALAYLKVAPDFKAVAATETEILYNHRRLGDDEIYFIANHSAQSVAFTGAFRADKLYPQAWNPETGTVGDITDYKFQNGQSHIKLKLEGHQSMFIVFSKTKVGQQSNLTLVNDVPVWRKVNEGWTIHYNDAEGKTNEKALPQLTSWTDMQDDWLKSYAGTITYQTSVNMDAKPTGKLLLDLGEVDVIAHLKVNGKDIGTIWKKPYAFEVSNALRAGTNQIEIAVTNLWVNRLITDSGLPAEKRVSSATYNPYKPTDKFLPSGLIGPVVIRQEIQK